jgi:hypothetical protein
MKWLVLASLTCNQLVYDQIYEALTHQAVRTQDYTSRANAIETLRTLCHNQRFTMEIMNKGARHINKPIYPLHYRE